MRYLFLSLIIIVLACAAACSPSNAGKFELPVRNPSMTEVIVPSGPLVAGEAYDFTAIWINGRPTYQVTWTFDDALNPGSAVAHTEEKTHTLAVGVLNDVAEQTEYSGSVTVFDYHAHSSTMTFTYTVAPAG